MNETIDTIIEILITITGCLLITSGLLTAIYLLSKRITLQLVAHYTHAGYIRYLYKKYRKPRKSKKI